jgi:hypothetical protein
VAIVFPPLGTLALDCRDALGRVPASIDVQVEREGAREPRRNGLAPEGGRFLLPVSQGPVRVSVTAPGYRKTPFAPVYVVGDAVNEAAIPLGHPLPILDVLVVDPSGAPVPGVDVSITGRAPRTADPAPSETEIAGIKVVALPQEAGFTLDLTKPGTERTSLDGWARFVRDIEEPEDLEVRVGPPHPAPGPFRQVVRVPATGRVTATFLVVPRPFVRAKSESEPPPAPLLEGDVLIEWDGWPLRLKEEVPRRWMEPVVVRLDRGGEERTVTLPPMKREFDVLQLLLPPR